MLINYNESLLTAITILLIGSLDMQTERFKTVHSLTGCNVQNKVDLPFLFLSIYFSRWSIPLLFFSPLLSLVLFSSPHT